MVKNQAPPQPATTLPFIAAEYEDRKVTIRRNPNYRETIASVKRVFESLASTPDKLILLCARFEEVGDDVQITEELWSELMPRLVVVKVLLDRPSEPACTDCKGMQISVKMPNGKIASIEVFPDTIISQLKVELEAQEGVSLEQHRLRFEVRGAEPFEEESTIAECQVEEGSKLEAVHKIIFLKVKKPVIYLLPPTAIVNARVQLSLVKAWNFSTLYPPTDIGTHKSLGLGQSVTWTVDAKPDGSLFDHGTGREVSYLYWEADAITEFLPSPASSRPGTPSAEPVAEVTPAFDPSRPTLSPSNSVLLPLDKVTEYIDDVLIALGLHTEARTSFITFWLPDLQKHSFIALRFMPQDQYEAAAPLNVTPAPEVTTRVFMLFKGVGEAELGPWESARSMAGQDAVVWRDIIGVNHEKAQDTGLFRVLEWGGMEVN